MAKVSKNVPNTIFLNGMDAALISQYSTLMTVLTNFNYTYTSRNTLYYSEHTNYSAIVVRDINLYFLYHH